MNKKKSRLENKSNEPYFVAEMNTSHFGNLANAKKMIKNALNCGFDCVKFQSWSPDSLYSSKFLHENPVAARFFKKYSLSPSQLKELSKYCNEIGIEFSSTPYSHDEVDFLIDECKASFVKVASMDLNNHAFLNYISLKKVPVVLSTGMGTMEEIDSAVSIFEKGGIENICILHCVSLYPTPRHLVNLKNISSIIERFPKSKVGYSDHTEDIETAIASIALGASLIEKHFTLDKKKIGFDNQMASEPDLLKDLILKCKSVYHSLGTRERRVSKEELAQREKMRRSIVAATNLERKIISIDDVEFKRPGNGMSTEKVGDILGKKLKIPKLKGSIILPSDLE